MVFRSSSAEGEVGAAETRLTVEWLDVTAAPPPAVMALELVFFVQLARLATRAGVEGAGMTIHTPLIDLSKAEIILAGTELGVDYALTVSCYQADEDGVACGVCDSCRLRAEGFHAAGIVDPSRYRA